MRTPPSTAAPPADAPPCAAPPPPPLSRAAPPADAPPCAAPPPPPLSLSLAAKMQQEVDSYYPSLASRLLDAGYVPPAWLLAECGKVEPAADFARPDRRVLVGDGGPQPSPAAATPQPHAAGSSEVEWLLKIGENPPSAGLAASSKAPRSFIEVFGDQGEGCHIQSSKLKNIATPELRDALSLLAQKYNTLFDNYQKQSSKCANECVPRYDGLNKKYVEECTERRRLYNELIEVRGNIRVFCRCRPLSTDEVTRGCTSVVKIDPSCETDLQYLQSENEKKVFRFDRVFGPEDGQEAVFSETVPVVRSVMDGFNLCIFAYGATGTGKTFTMEGVQENRGVNYRAVEELFRMSEERRASIKYTFSVSIMEVYNEQINDLLDKSSKKMEIKTNKDGTHDVAGLADAPVYTTDGVWEKLKLGATNRSVGSTNANELSSRSHSLVRVTVNSQHLVTGQQSKNYMWLVDLAGSERMDQTGAEAQRLKESQHINQSLVHLSCVMQALASKSSHIPYRNSKLTRLLESSLGGDCKTLMFMQISPSSSNSEETRNTLNYAPKVRAIELGPARKRMVSSFQSEKHKDAATSSELGPVRKRMVSSFQSEKHKDAATSSRPPLVPMPQNKIAVMGTKAHPRPPLVPMPQNKLNIPMMGTKAHPRPPLVPMPQNKVSIPVMATKAHPRTDKENVVGKGKARLWDYK